VLPPAAIAAAVWVIASLDPAQVWKIARAADAWWLIASIVPLPIRFLVWGIKSGAMIRREGDVSIAETTRGLVAGAFLNLVTPTARVAGGLYRAAAIRRRAGWRFSRAYGWIFADQVTNGAGSLALFGVLALAAAATIADDVLAGALRAAGAICLVAVALFLLGRRRLWNALRRPPVRDWMSRWRPLWSTRAHDDPDPRPWYVSWLAPTLEGREGPLRLATDVFLAALSWSMLCLSNALVFRAIGVSAPVPLLATALVLGTFAGGFVGMGGIGLTEAALVGLYTQLGVSGPEAAAAALLHRASYYGVILAWGSAAFVRIGSRDGRRRRPDPSTGATNRPG